jgi:hypothetical protein
VTQTRGSLLGQDSTVPVTRLRLDGEGLEGYLLHLPPPCPPILLTQKELRSWRKVWIACIEQQVRAGGRIVAPTWRPHDQGHWNFVRHKLLWHQGQPVVVLDCQPEHPCPLHEGAA